MNPEGHWQGLQRKKESSHSAGKSVNQYGGYSKNVKYNSILPSYSLSRYLKDIILQNQAQRHTPIISVLRRLRLEDSHKFEASPDYTKRPYFKNKKDWGQSLVGRSWDQTPEHTHAHTNTKESYEKYLIFSLYKL